MLTKENLRGIWGALMNSWDESNRLNEGLFREDTIRLAETGVSGLYTTGTTGEFYTMDEVEFRQMVKIFAESAQESGVLTQVGCTWIDTNGAIRRAKIAEEYGIHGIQVALPFWMSLNDDEVVRFFADLSQAVPGMPIIHYNTARSKRVLDAKMYRRIVAEVPALIGSKQTTFDMGALIDVFIGAPEINHFASDWLLVPCMLLGAKGAYSSLVTINPHLILRWYAMWERGEWEDAMAIQNKFLRVIVEVDDPVLELGYLDQAGDKAYAQLTGFLKGSKEVRAPFTTMPDEILEQIRHGIMERMPELLTLD